MKLLIPFKKAVLGIIAELSFAAYIFIFAFLLSLIIVHLPR